MHQPEVLPEAPDDGLLVKTLYAGICHVELGSSGVAGNPAHVEAHNICGKVLSVGGNVSEVECDIRVGDVILVYPWPGCGQCETCSAGNSHQCDEDEDVTAMRSPRKADHETVAPRGGPFANFQVVLDWHHAIRLPREIPPQLGCQLPCGVLRVYSAMLEARSCFEQAIRVRGFSNLLIVCGNEPDGLESWCVQILKNVFCERNVKVVCVGPRRDILDRAVQSGVDDAVHLEFPPTDDESTPDIDASTLNPLIDQITMSGYNRMDVALDLCGDSASVTVAVRSLHRGGTVFELGSRHHHRSTQQQPPVERGRSKSSTAPVPLTLDELVARSVSLRPITTGSAAMLRQLVDVVAIQQVKVDAVVIECFRSDDLQLAVDRYREHQATGPVVIKFD